MKNKYLFGVLLAITVIAINQLFIQYWLYNKNQDAVLINLSGRQRMLSQKLNLEVYKHQNGQASLSQLKDTFLQWKTMHKALLEGNKELGLNGIKDGEIRDSLLKITANINFIDKQLQNNVLDVNAINQNQSVFLAQMDLVVKMLQLESDNKLLFIVVIEVLLALLSIAIITYEVKFIYKPISERLKSIINTLADSEAKLLAILNGTNDNHILVTKDFKISSFNRMAKRNCRKILRKEITEGSYIWNYMDPEHKTGIVRDLELALKEKPVTHEVEVYYGNTSKWFKLKFFPAYNSKERVIGVTITAEDVDRRRRAENKIKVQNELLQEQNDKLLKIAWQQSHEVRKPISNILLIVNMLRSGKYETEEEIKKNLENLYVSTEELDKVVKRIVNYTIMN